MIRTLFSKASLRMGLAAAIVALASPAFAHAHLKAAVPAAGSKGATPSELDLTFTEALNLKFSGVKVSGPDKIPVSLGDAMLMNKNTTLMVPVAGPLLPGTYTVEWHALSDDGHKTNGSYTFTVTR